VKYVFMLLFFVANLGCWLTFWKWKVDRWRAAGCWPTAATDMQQNDGPGESE
jgi:hypothetical protein